MKPFQYAIIGGTGVYDSGVSSFQKTVQTEYGEVEVDIAEVENHDEEGNDDDHEMAIHIDGVKVGTTSFKLELMHAGHADFTSTNNVSITVLSASNSSNSFSCTGSLCLKACCTRVLYAAK